MKAWLKALPGRVWGYISSAVVWLFKKLKMPLFVLAGAALLLGLSYFILPSTEKPSVEVSIKQTVVQHETKKEVVTPPASLVVAPPVSESKSEIKEEPKSSTKGFDISSWVPDLTPRTWLILLLFTAAGIAAHHERWFTAEVLFAVGVALLTFPSITLEGLVDGTWIAKFPGLLSSLQTSASSWGVQQWLALAAGLLGIILFLPSRPAPATPTDKKPIWGGVFLGVAAVLLIVPPSTFTGDWQTKGSGILERLTGGSINPLPTECSGKEISITLKDSKVPLPNCLFHVDTDEGILHFENKAGRTYELRADDENPQWPKGFNADFVRGNPLAKARFTFRPK